MASVWDEVDDVLEAFDSGFRVQSESGCAWFGELRVTMTDPEGAPSRSLTFYAAGAGDPEGVARAVLDDFETWQRETGDRPMPLPVWLRVG